MKVTRAICLLSVLVACAADDPPPSCQEAFDHFYAASCTLVDTSTGAQVPKATAITDCNTIATDAPRNCRDEVFDWLRCTLAVPSPAMSDADCRCMAEVTALQSCQ
jgi:hypothetical protein